MTLGWLSPIAQIWHVEVLLLGALLIRVTRNDDGRPKFEALMLCNFIFDVAGLFMVRTGRVAIYNSHAWWWYVIGCPLTALALMEAVDRGPASRDRHSTILAWWIAATIACLGIRFYPWSNRALLAMNATFYLWWIMDKRHADKFRI